MPESSSSEEESDDDDDDVDVNGISLNVPKVVLPPRSYMYTNEFLEQVENTFHHALSYKDQALQENARKIIPQLKLQLAAQRRLRHLQEQVKKGKLEDPDVSVQDMMLLELLAWFKTDFFSWVDSPNCTHCKGTTRFSHMSKDPAVLIHTTRVEVYVCNDCQQLTTFPRYNDVNILLITRRGRCGEWANTFTLMCCALGFDARHVVDQGDHVWTEVYSSSQKRWLHCDPCENACDTPLMYETGWGKDLSYVIAYSPEEVQDVTWRYSSKHKDVAKKRNKCTEMELSEALMELRTNRQNSVSAARREYLTKRLLAELVELMIEKKPNESDQQGRTSGSLVWRLERGEIQDAITSFTWTIDKNTNAKTAIIRYSPALNQYEMVVADNKHVRHGWNLGVFSYSDMFRKEEKDWKMVYLARKEGTSCGKISWKFDLLDNPNMVIDTIDIKFDYKVFEDGSVDLEVNGGNIHVKFPKNDTQLQTNELSGCKSFGLTATLMGGKGSQAWQHAQLFRQSVSSKEYPFSVEITFKHFS